ncbi:MAG: hypothetical protein M3R24_18145 [Chloroflexota bacterium]|nr:hypothetical protein [Chloroflexota bacterium]
MGNGLNPKAIETLYNGYRFRSRLEARWAVFFDALDIRYEYEKEGYDLNGLWYLPDFWLPKQQAWVEIKPMEPSDEEMQKASLLSEMQETYVVIFSDGLPSDNGKRHYADGFYGWYRGERVLGNNWMECRTCGHIDLLPGIAGAVHCLWCDYSKPEQLIRSIHLELILTCKWSDDAHRRMVDTFYDSRSPRLVTAYDAARQAQFEHGKGRGPG